MGFYNVRDKNGRFVSKNSNCGCCCSNNVQSHNIQSQIENHFCLVVDSSGSMCGLNSNVVRFVNKWISDIREATQKFSQVSKVSLITYSDKASLIFTNVDINNVPQFSSYYPGGMTALFEAQELAIDTLIKNTENRQGNISYVVNHITDGHENNSWKTGFGVRNYLAPGKTIQSVVSSMINLQRSNQWTFTFLLPPGHKNSFVSSYGLEAGNIEEWEATQEGIYNAEVQTSKGLFTYCAARGAGLMSVTNFYGK